MANQLDYGRLLGFVGRFSLTHVFAYVLVGTGFVALLSGMPRPDLIAIQFFEPYRPLDASVIGWQAVRGVVMGLIFFPFYDAIIARKRGDFVLFNVVLGFSIIGSVQPMPGSIEGVLYTVTTPLEHSLVLGASAIHVGLLTGVFVRWERWSNPEIEVERVALIGDAVRDALFRFLSRFTILHVLTYVLAGIVFMEIQDYETAFETMAAFELYRPLDGMVGLFVFPTQIVRGLLFGLLLLPLYDRIFRESHGWLYLFGLFWGITLMGSPNAIQGLFESLVTSPVSETLLGTAEVTVQMALFSVLIWWWERRSNANLRQEATRLTRSNGH